MLTDPLWIGSGPPLAAWLHRPEDSMVHAIAVACGPVLGEDATKGRMAFIALAEILSDRGIALLRFDYEGTGDSAGSSMDVGQVQRWRDSVKRAVDYACQITYAPCILVGMRLGSIFAADVAQEDSRISGILLWDPVYSVRRYLREQKIFVSSVFGVAQPEDGSFAGAGYTLARDSVADLEGLVLTSPDGRVADRTASVLIATRVGDRSGAPEVANFAKVGAKRLELRGQAALMELPPHEVRPDRVDLRALAEWISERSGTAEWPAAPSIVDHAEMLVQVESATQWGPSLVDPPKVIERFRRLGSVPLYGVETDPGVAGDPLATVVFLSAGALERFGPGRLWVELARNLAAKGVSSIRVDNSGVGDTPSRNGLRRGVMLDPGALTDLRDICEALDAPNGSGLIFVGLSSGAYHAAEAGLSLQPTAICMVNGSALDNPPELSRGDRVDPRRRAYKPMWPAFRRLAVSHKRLAKVVWHGVGNVAVSASPASIPVRIAERGVNVLTLATGADRGAFGGNLYWFVRARRARRRGMLEEYRFAIEDHPLYTEDARRVVGRVLLDFLVEHATSRTFQ